MTTIQKNALVTGAGRGIGAAIAGVLARKGFRVILADVDGVQAEKTANELGDEHIGLSLDVSKSQEVDFSVAELVDSVGQIHVLVNNAGINRDAMLHKMTNDQWDQVISVDLSGVFYTCRAVGSHMREKGYGRIVNISSASWEGNIGQTNYAAAKAGVVGLTRTLSKELARFTITANAICPGFIDTEMTRGLPEKIHQAQLEKIPLGRAGDPSDVGNAVAFFASEEAAYVTGQTLAVGGGYQI
jgi:3-oxoacyl-[acyl-carrier protein] reductase/2-hydroxycyclohexanecarboxyl-CoA dehydrogenase